MAIATPLPGKKTGIKRVFYPTSDGEPMGETDKHVSVMFYCIESLRSYFFHRPDVYVAGDNFLYYVEGDPKKVVSPDCYVVFGAGMRLRDLYKVWEEGGLLPSVVFEITSKSTQKADIEKKLPLYEQILKVAEYFLFDPTGDYLQPRLQGYRLLEDRYVPLLPASDRLYSEQLGLELVIQGEEMRFHDPVRGITLPTPSEALQRAEAAEAELERLRAELERLRQRPS